MPASLFSTKKNAPTPFWFMLQILGWTGLVGAICACIAEGFRTANLLSFLLVLITVALSKKLPERFRPTPLIARAGTLFAAYFGLTFAIPNLILGSPDYVVIETAGETRYIQAKGWAPIELMPFATRLTAFNDTHPLKASCEAKTADGKFVSGDVTALMTLPWANLESTYLAMRTDTALRSHAKIALCMQYGAVIGKHTMGTLPERLNLDAQTLDAESALSSFGLVYNGPFKVTNLKLVARAPRALQP